MSATGRSRPSGACLSTTPAVAAYVHYPLTVRVVPYMNTPLLVDVDQHTLNRPRTHPSGNNRNPTMQHEPALAPLQNRVDRLLRILFYAHRNTAVSIVVFNAILIVLVAATVGVGMVGALLLSLI